MSGGRLDHLSGKLNTAADQIENDAGWRAEFPRLHAVMPELLRLLADIEREVDWHLCGDCRIANPADFEEKQLQLVHELLARQ